MTGPHFIITRRIPAHPADHFDVLEYTRSSIQKLTELDIQPIRERMKGHMGHIFSGMHYLNS